MAKHTIVKLPTTPDGPPEEQPKKRKGRKKRPTVTDIHEGELYINGEWLHVIPPMKRPSRSEMRKEAWQEIKQDIREKVNAFFDTCFGEFVMLCIVCFLIALFIVLILKIIN